MDLIIIMVNSIDFSYCCIDTITVGYLFIISTGQELFVINSKLVIVIIISY